MQCCVLGSVNKGFMISGNLEFNERDTGHWKRKEKRPTLPGSRKVFIKQLLLESRAEIYKADKIGLERLIQEEKKQG